MTSYSRLIDAWVAYNRATQILPYNRDRVQGLGLAFAYRFNAQKDRLCVDLKIDPDEFSYGMKYDIMEKLV